MPHPEKDLKSSSSKRLEARFPYHDSRAASLPPPSAFQDAAEELVIFFSG